MRSAMIGLRGLFTQFDRDRKHRLDWPQFGAAINHVFRESGGMPREAQVNVPISRCLYTLKREVVVGV
jgi:hypothetical protein